LARPEQLRQALFGLYRDVAHEDQHLFAVAEVHRQVADVPVAALSISLVPCL